MIIRFAEDTEIAQWDQHVIANPDGGNFLQGMQFAEQKKAGGWRARFLFIDTLSVMILEKRVFGLGRIWYVPKGPGVQTAEQLGAIIGPLRDFASSGRIFAIKIEPELLKTEQNVAALTSFKLQPCQPIQPNFSTIVLDLHSDLETVMASLPQNGRYAINRAVRDGVTVEPVRASNINCKIMYDLLLATAQGAKFGIRSFEYYEDYWRRFETAGQGQMFFAMYQGKVVACAYAVIYGSKSTYKDGASVREREAYGASHLLQWHVIQWAKSRGSVSHDLCGAPPVEEVSNKEHPHYGIGLFKRSFSPNIIQYVGCYEITVRSFAHFIWRKIGEKITRRLYASKHHESYY